MTTFSKSIKSSYNFIKKNMVNGSLFRGEWYITNTLLSSSDKPKYLSYRNCDNLIKQIKLNSKIKQAIFVFDLKGKFISKFNGILEAEKYLKIRHEKIKQSAISKTPEGKYLFSYHRILD
jgi:hypothetical protein